ncbi:ATP-binding protein [Streptomyces avermitilis]|uniref:ATP-binding protein n=1 Tax=Streptomyces avermitilis TaxID=33903 RepID=UPI0033B8F05A
MTSQLPSPISASQPACPGADLSRTFEMRFTSTPRGARLARRLAAHRLDAWGIPYGTRPHEEIVLVLGELTANAVRHGHVPSRDFHLLLHVIAPSSMVRVEVTDTRAERTPPDPEALRAPGAEDTGGRGLLLVAAFATRWGWHLRHGGPGKTVWAECVFTTGSGATAHSSTC